jgi:hypothetical protein
VFWKRRQPRLVFQRDNSPYLRTLAYSLQLSSSTESFISDVPLISPLITHNSSFGQTSIKFQPAICLRSNQRRFSFFSSCFLFLFSRRLLFCGSWSTYWRPCWWWCSDCYYSGESSSSDTPLHPTYPPPVTTDAIRIRSDSDGAGAVPALAFMLHRADSIASEKTA